MSPSPEWGQGIASFGVSENAPTPCGVREFSRLFSE